MRSILTSAAALVCAAGAALTGACADSPTGLEMSGESAAGARTSAHSGPVHAANPVNSQVTSADTVVTTFVVGTNLSSTDVSLGNGSKIIFPYALGSVCDPATSSYGAGTWDSPCRAATQPITITAKTWIDRSTGKMASDFRPALRFVPGLKNKVKLYLKDANYTSRDQVWYCADGGACSDEATSDKSLAAIYDKNNQWVARVVKHFSGYIVTF